MKRLFDIAGSALALILLSPVLLLLYSRIAKELGKPVLFRQQRPGFNGRIFNLVKFRSMTDECDANGQLLPDDQRLPTFGFKLRASSLDELPTLWNVLKGDMSLVGPRPLLPQYLDRYNERQARRHDVKPGVTGWAQINGRNAISWEEKFELDVWYVENRSVWLDIKILFLTVKQVLMRDGISADGEVTMPIFLGSAKETKSGKDE